MISPFYIAMQRMYRHFIDALTPPLPPVELPGEDGLTSDERADTIPVKPIPMPIPNPLSASAVKKDKITLARIELLHPKVRVEAGKIYQDICEALTGRGICRFTYTLRTFREQNELYAIGRSKPGKKVTQAAGGHSYHNYGLAIDICLIIDGKEASWDTSTDFDADKLSDWMEVVKIFRSYGWEWGGDWSGFRDLPHFQKTMGRSISLLLAMYTSQLFVEGQYVAI